VGPKGDQGVHLLRIATILYSELLRKVPPTEVYGSISGCDLRGMTKGGCGIRTGELVRLGEEIVKISYLYVLL
jgi:hypothetical protein